MIALVTETIIVNFGKNSSTKVLKTDLSKAYDTVNVNHLIFKLKFYYGIEGKLFKTSQTFSINQENLCKN